ncbi:MAG: hypothetical protein QXZ19_00660 [Thermoplasmata archaeon]
MRIPPKRMLLELPTADEIDDLAVSSPSFEVRKFDIDLRRRKADLGYAPCKGYVVVVARSEAGIAFVRRRRERAWSLPSDRIGANEAIAKSPRRVAREQCGIGLRIVELAGIYDVVMHFLDVSIKRLHVVYACIAEEPECTVSAESDISEARFFDETPSPLHDRQIVLSAIADAGQK